MTKGAAKKSLRFVMDGTGCTRRQARKALRAATEGWGRRLSLCYERGWDRLEDARSMAASYRGVCPARVRYWIAMERVYLCNSGFYF